MSCPCVGCLCIQNKTVKKVNVGLKGFVLIMVTLSYQINLVVYFEKWLGHWLIVHIVQVKVFRHQVDPRF